MNKIIEIGAPVSGKVKDITDVSDEVFSDKILGDGFAIEPNDNVIFSPCNGKIVTISDTNHAITMLDDNDIEILIHIGIDTVLLKGEGFKPLVTNGESVVKGQALMKVDFSLVEKNHYSKDTILVILSKDLKIQKRELNEEVIHGEIVLLLSDN